MGMMLHRHPALVAVEKKLAAAKPEPEKKAEAEPVEAVEEKPKKARKATKKQ